MLLRILDDVVLSGDRNQDSKFKIQDSRFDVILRRFEGIRAFVHCGISYRSGVKSPYDYVMVGFRFETLSEKKRASTSRFHRRSSPSVLCFLCTSSDIGRPGRFNDSSADSCLPPVSSPCSGTLLLPLSSCSSISASSCRASFCLYRCLSCCLPSFLSPSRP